MIDAAYSGLKPGSGIVVKTITYFANSSDCGFGILPFPAAFRMSFRRAIPITTSDFLIAQTRPSTEAADPLQSVATSQEATVPAGPCPRRLRAGRTGARPGVHRPESGGAIPVPGDRPEFHQPLADILIPDIHSLAGLPGCPVLCSASQSLVDHPAVHRDNIGRHVPALRLSFFTG